MEFDNVIVKENPGLCRCCLSEGCYKDLGTEYNWMGETEVYADMLMECFDISISQHSDGPNGTKRLLSEVCITRIRDACNFKKQVLDSENKFIDMLGRGEFKSDVLVYRAPMKEEVQIEVNPTQDDGLVEYLDEDMDFMGDKDDDCDKEEPNTSNQEEKVIASSLNTRTMTRIKKRSATTSRVEKKKTVKKAAVKEGRVSKEKTEKSRTDLTSGIGRLPMLRKNVTEILNFTTAMPFRRQGKIYKCFYCHDMFSLANDLREHTKNEHKAVALEHILKKHIWRDDPVHVDVTDLKCKYCDVDMTDLEELIEHIIEEHGSKYDKEVGKCFRSYKLTDGTLACLICGEEFHFFNYLFSHTVTEHEEGKLYRCDHCGQGFTFPRTLAVHVETIHMKTMKYKCKFCDKTYLSLYYRNKHENDEHREKTLKCPKCPELFPTAPFLKAHMKAVHKEGWIDCDLCDRQFRNRGVLVVHKKSAHFGQRDVNCGVCGKSFVTNRYLKLHMALHSDEKPFECGTCKKAFARKNTLRMHERIHVNDKRYCCKVCGEKFVQCASLKRHMKKHI